MTINMRSYANMLSYVDRKTQKFQNYKEMLGNSLKPITLTLLVLQVQVQQLWKKLHQKIQT